MVAPCPAASVRRSETAMISGFQNKSRNSKITKHGFQVVINEDILRFDISVINRRIEGVEVYETTSGTTELVPAVKWIHQPKDRKQKRNRRAHKLEFIVAREFGIGVDVRCQVAILAPRRNKHWHLVDNLISDER